MVINILFAGLSIVAAVYALRAFRGYRLATESGVQRIQSAPSGYVAVKGQFHPLVASSPAIAPFSGKPCVWYEASVKKKNVDFYSDGDAWQTLFQEKDPRPCLLSDETGTCLVVPAQADELIGLAHDSYGKDALENDPPEPLRHVDKGFFERPLRFEEKRIELEQPGYAVGRFRTTVPSDVIDGTGNSAADRVFSLFRGWRDAYMADVEGRPDKHQPNTIQSLEELPTDQQEALPAAALAWSRKTANRDDITRVVTAPTEPLRPCVVGTGEEPNLSKGLRRRAIQSASGAVALAALSLVHFVMSL